MRLMSVPHLSLSAVSCGFALSLLASPASGQFEDCGDTIALYSPTGFSVAYEVAPNPQRVDGVRLRWLDMPDSLAGCSRVSIDPLLESRLGVEVRGEYRNTFDRNIVFDFPQAGVIGDPNQARLELSVANGHPNPTAGNLSSILNLSSAGGVYRFTPQLSSNSAYQVNSGIPAHLGDVSINDFAVASDGSVTYAAVVGVPVLRSYDGGMTWDEPVERVFPPFSQRMNAMVVFPDDPNRLWVAVDSRGIWESTDAAETWTQIFPARVGATSTVSVMKFLRVVGPDGSSPVDRLYLGARGQSLAFSDDSGSTFTEVGRFEVPVVNSSPAGATCTDPQLNRADVFDIELSPNDPARIYVGLSRWGVYTGLTTDHSGWESRYDGLVICDTDGDPDRPLGEQRTVVQLEVLDNAGQDVLVAATQTQVSPTGMPDLRAQTITFVSVDGGLQWTGKGDGFPINDDGDAVAITSMVKDPRPGNSLGVIAATFGRGLWELNLAGGPGQGNWIPVDFDPSSEIRNPRTSSIFIASNGDLLVGTSNSGVYTAGVWIDLTRALNRTAQSFSEVEQLGLQVRFTEPGALSGGESFSVKAQNFRGYAVWRAADFDRAADVPVWELIGLLDLANPETCVDAACDEIAQPITVNCFANKRANCFVPQLNDEAAVVSWEFFDRDIFNGFTYWYAVTTFDFGYTGETSMESFDGGMVFSPRWSVENDPASSIYNDLAGGQNYNGEEFQVNVAAVDADDESVRLGDVEVFVVPNPLVRAAGWDLGDASSVRIVNVTESSRAQFYTLAGDLVREIENVQFAGIERGNIEWDTRNSDGEPVASGVYIYRVIDDKGGEVMGRLTIVR